MTKQDLESLGLGEGEVLDMLTDKLCARLLDDSEQYATDFERRINDAVKKQVDARLDAALEQHILPKVTEMVDGICLQETNRWGEKQGTPVSFIEYLVQRVDYYIREDVNYKGKGKDEDSYSWSKHSTRIVWLINQHLQYSIDAAMKKALGDVNSSVRKGLEDAVKHAIASVKVTVNTKVE